MKLKKSTLIAIMSIVVIVIIVLVGVILFLTTDIFKSNQEMFYKYAVKNIEAMEMMKKNNINTQEQQKYSTQGEITFNLISNNPQLANQTIPARNFKIEYNAKTDKEQQSSSMEATLKYLTKDLFTLKYIKDENKYALKSDEVINKYLAFENNNLKEYANKLGVQDVNDIPNQIGAINLEQLLYISQEDKDLILQKYLDVINTKIPKTNYTKQKYVNITVKDKIIATNAYTLQLTNEEYKEVKKAILETLSNDEKILNILESKIKMIDQNSDLNVEKIRNAIQELINKEDNTDYGTRKITVYENQEELVRTTYSDANGEIILDFAKADTAKSLSITNNYEIPKQEAEEEIPNPVEDEFENIQGDIQNDNTQQDNQTQQNTELKGKLKTVEIAKEEKDTNLQKIIILTLEVNEKPVKVAIQIKKSSDQANGTIQNTAVINVNIADETYFTTNINQTSTVNNDIQIEKLDNNNSAIVNNFTKDYTNQLSAAIIARLKQLYQGKRILVTQTQAQENQIQAEQAAQNQTQNNGTEQNEITNQVDNTTMLDNNTINNNV